MHPPEVGGLGGLVALVGLSHGLGDVLDEGEVGEDVSPAGRALLGILPPGILTLAASLEGLLPVSLMASPRREVMRAVWAGREE